MDLGTDIKKIKNRKNTVYLPTEKKKKDLSIYQKKWCLIHEKSPIEKNS